MVGMRRMMMAVRRGFIERGHESEDKIIITRPELRRRGLPEGFGWWGTSRCRGRRDAEPTAYPTPRRVLGQNHPLLCPGSRTTAHLPDFLRALVSSTYIHKDTHPPPHDDDLPSNPPHPPPTAYLWIVVVLGRVLPFGTTHPSCSCPPCPCPRVIMPVLVVVGVVVGRRNQHKMSHQAPPMHSIRA
jgi:hypothetical protein